VRYFSAEQLLERLQMSGEQLNKFEQEGIVKGIVKAGRVSYTSRDVYRLRGILFFLGRGLAREEALRHVDQPPDEAGGQVS
jgi:DNA-binding transcriptional MerR regulator